MNKIKMLFLHGFFSLFFLLVAPLLSTHIHAQGTYTCQSENGIDCTVSTNNCMPGYEAQCYGKNPCLEYPNEYYCSQITPQSESLDLNSLYNAIQPLGSNPLFRMTRFTTSSNIGTLLNAINLIIFPLAGLVLLLYLLYGGYNMMLSGGDPKKAASAKGIITTALLGFVVIFLSYWIVRIVGSILGLTDFSRIFY